VSLPIVVRGFTQTFFQPRTFSFLRRSTGTSELAFVDLTQDQITSYLHFGSDSLVKHRLSREDADECGNINEVNYGLRHCAPSWIEHYGADTFGADIPPLSDSSRPTLS
jgi:hypothetical protein